MRGSRHGMKAGSHESALAACKHYQELMAECDREIERLTRLLNGKIDPPQRALLPPPRLGVAEKGSCTYCLNAKSVRSTRCYKKMNSAGADSENNHGGSSERIYVIHRTPSLF